MNDTQALVNNSVGSTMVFKYVYLYLSSQTLYTATARSDRPQPEALTPYQETWTTAEIAHLPLKIG
jgi:hypothetical protein